MELFSYYFGVVALGTMVLGLASGIIGSAIVIEQQSQLSDAISHSVYPGIVLSFILFQTRSPLILMLGAVMMGFLAYHCIQRIFHTSHLSYDGILALVLSGFFGLGLVFSSYIQGNPNFQHASQSGIKNYIMGQAAYLMISDVQLIVVVSLLCLVLFAWKYPQIQLVLFDKALAAVQGIKVKRLQNLIMFLALCLICVGLKAVGAILMSCLLIVPTVAALQWTKHYSHLITLSGLFGVIAAFLGTFVSTRYQDIATGPSIVVILAAIGFISLLFGPRSYLQQKWHDFITHRKEVNQS